MEALLRKYKHLSDGDYGQIIKMILKYLDGETIGENYGDIKNILFFDRYVKKDLDKLIKDRNRKRGNIKS